MPTMRWLMLWTVALAMLASLAGAVEYSEPQKPAKARVASTRVGPPPAATDRLVVPIITWGADAATIVANGDSATKPDSPFGKAGLRLQLQKQDDFVAQVNDYLSGKSAFLRGTLGMINTYSEALNADPRTKPVVLLQLSWSTGGDCLVVREGIKTVADLKGRTVLLQQYGPHVEYLDQVLRDASLGWDDVTVKWCEELYDTDGKPNDPASIFRVTPGVDAIFCISPDAAALTSNMTTGTGAEGSVKGARVLLTTKSASRVIADVYAVRRDFFDANRELMKKFANAQIEGQKRVQELIKAKGKPEYTAFIRLAADKLLDNPEASADMEGMLADCSLALESGNADFFAGAGNLVGFAANTARNQSWLVAQKYLGVQQKLDEAGFFAGGTVATPALPKFRQEAAQKAVAESGEEGVLFEFEILFAPNQEVFDAGQYGDRFQRALELAATYSGAVLEIVGHSDPYRYLRMKIKEKASQEVLTRQELAGRNLSLARANAVRDSLLKYAKDKGITANESQFITTGRGYDAPKIPQPKTEDDLVKNRRVQFRIINIESEASEVFEPLF